MIIVSCAIILTYIGITGIINRSDTEIQPPILITTGILIFVMISFVSLTVKIDEIYLKIKFGYGIFRKRFLLDEIVSVEKVRNKRSYWRGIRMRLKPFMWIYNVSGLDAVEILMKNGKRYRIGTDEAKILEQAIKQRLR